MTGPERTPDLPLTSIGGEPLDPTVDLVRAAARSLLAGTLAGVGAAAIVLAVVRFLLRGAAPSDLPATGAPFFVLAFGTLAAMAIGAAVTWRGLAAIRSPYRRGVFAMIAGFATFVGALLATPVHYYLGISGLLALSAVSLLAGFALARRRSA